jgi:ketosteroid isomerase-like protein
VKGDVVAWSRCLAEDWGGTTPGGTMVTKAGAYADLKAGRVVRELFRLDDLKVRVYGDVAIVLGLETEKSMIHGKDMSGQYRFTDVFVKSDGRWQAVASHASRVSTQK